MSKPALNDSDIAIIRKLIIHWEGKITWSFLLSLIKNDLGIIISRQSLCKYEVIYNEYNRKKEIQRGIISNDKMVTVADTNEINKITNKLKIATEERDLYKRDYELAQKVINRIIINANSIPDLDIQLLFNELG